jgi:hypothetical protein
MIDDALIVAAAELSSSAPRQWVTFLEQLSAYAERKRDEMMRSPPDGIHAAQGRAQNASKFFELMRDCRAIAQKIQTQAQKRG